MVVVGRCVCAARLQTVRLELEEGGEAEVPRRHPIHPPPPAPRHDSCLPPAPRTPLRLLRRAPILWLPGLRPLSSPPRPGPRLFVHARTQEAEKLSLPILPGGLPGLRGWEGVAPPDSDAGYPAPALSPGAPFRRLSLSLTHTHHPIFPHRRGPGSPTPTIPSPPGSPGWGPPWERTSGPGGRGALGRRLCVLSSLPFLGRF